MRGDMYPISPRIFYYLLAILVFWTVFPLLSRVGFDSYGDMFENYVWGIRWQWGNDKHPPLFGWTVAAWFELLPRNKLNYWLLASLNIVISLAIMIAIARRLLNEKQQDAALLVALFLPLLGFQAFRYNANAAMLPYWAAIILFYMRLYEKPRIIDAAALGVVAALAMLSKYFSATLIIALFIHAMFVPHMRAMVFGRVGSIATAVFGAVLLPHILWLIDNDFRPFVFAASEQGDASLNNILYRQAEFFIGQIVYLLPGLFVLVFFRSIREGWKIFSFTHLPQVYANPIMVLVLWSFAGPVMIAMLLAIATWTPLTSNWSLPIHIVAPLLLVTLLPVERVGRKPWLTPLLVAVFFAVALIATPFARDAELAKARHIAVVPFEALAKQAEDIWQSTQDGPMRALGGNTDPVQGMAYFSKTKIQVLKSPNPSASPWININDFKDEALLLICAETNCAKEWQANDWKLTNLPDLQVDALEGAGGPPVYRYHIWAAKKTGA